MSEDLLRVNHNLTTERWSLENGYDNEKSDERPMYPFRTNDASLDGGLNILLFLTDMDPTDICRGPSSGFKIMLHLPVELPHVSKKFMSLPLDSELKIAVKPNVVKTSPSLRYKYDPSVRQCFFTSERQLRFFRVYTQQNCEMECLANFTKSYCGCVRFSMPSNLSACFF